jgi:hypothetical protein
VFLVADVGRDGAQRLAAGFAEIGLAESGAPTLRAQFHDVPPEVPLNGCASTSPSGNWTAVDFSIEVAWENRESDIT